jgi:hypothetical protein
MLKNAPRTNPRRRHLSVSAMVLMRRSARRDIPKQRLDSDHAQRDGDRRQIESPTLKSQLIRAQWQSEWPSSWIFGRIRRMWLT